MSDMFYEEDLAIHKARVKTMEQVKQHYDHRRVTVVTNNIRPPVGTRNMDWEALLDGYEKGDPIGYGPTEADAVYSLFVALDERELEAEEEHETTEV